MTDFYLKIKKRDSEIEFSTDDEKLFDEKIKNLLTDFGISKAYQNENQLDEQKTEENVAPQQLHGFVDIKPPCENINEIQENDNKEQYLTFEFEQILETAQKTPTIEFESSQNSNEEFCAFVASQNPQNDTDYLIFSAQYFLKYLNQPNFTLKQINSKLVPAKDIVITHKILNDAINNNWIEPVPDLTETSITKEYRLTQSGEFEYQNRIF